MSKKSDLFLNKTVGDDFLESLVKFDLYKPGTRSVVDHNEVGTALQIVPRVILSFLIQNLSSMASGENRKLSLPCGEQAELDVTKHERDVYSGSVLEKNKIVIDFKYRTIPGIGLILLSTFELYDVSTLTTEAQEQVKPDIASQVEKLIEERMALHSMIHAVVDKKMSERDAVKELVLARLTDKLKGTESELERERMRLAATGVAALGYAKPGDVPKGSTYHSASFDDAQSLYEEKERLRLALIAAGQPGDAINPEIRAYVKEPGKTPLITHDDIEKLDKKRPAVIAFMEKVEKKKLKKTEFSIVMAKGETVDCPDCKKPIFNDTKFSACICFGDSKTVHLKKTADGFKMSFPSSWDEEDMKMLLEILWRKNGKTNGK
jgi:hypothetical protein